MLVNTLLIAALGTLGPPTKATEDILRSADRTIAEAQAIFRSAEESLRLSREQEERGKAIERQSDAIRRGVVFPPGALIPPSVPLPPGQGPRPPVLPLIDSIVPPVLLPPGDPRPQVDKK